MMSNETTGHLHASGTSVSGFVSEKVFVNRSLSDKGYTLEGTSAEGERVVFFVRTLDVEKGSSFDIKEFYEEGTAYAAYENKKGERYEGVSGTIVFEVFDVEAGNVKIVSKLAMSNSSETKQVDARGEFLGIQENNKKVLDEKNIFKFK